jgi:hypothetical protein
MPPHVPQCYYNCHIKILLNRYMLYMLLNLESVRKYHCALQINTIQYAHVVVFWNNLNTWAWSWLYGKAQLMSQHKDSATFSRTTGLSLCLHLQFPRKDLHKQT